MSMNKTIVFIRHAHRDTEDRTKDNGLTAKGKKQAKRISEFYGKRFPKKTFSKQDVTLLSSPKLRCVETIQPIADATGIGLKLHESLTEAHASETYVELEARVKEFLNWWKADATPLTLACSHGDWLPIAVHELLGGVVYFKKGGWLEMDWLDDQAHLRWYIPTFKHLVE